MEQIMEYEELPTLVVDFASILKNGIPDPHKVSFLESAFNDFNLCLWRDTKFDIFKRGERAWKLFNKTFELDIAKEFKCSVDELKSFLEIKKTIIITTEPLLISKVGWRAVANFDYSAIRHNYETYCRTRGGGDGS